MIPQEVASKKTVLAVTTFTSFLSPFMASSVTIALPSISREFSMDAVSLSWIATSYLLASAVFLLPLGRMADLYGRKRIFLYGMWIFTFASLMCGLSFSGSFLILSRVVQGIGVSMLFGTAVAILTSVFPPGERGRVLGINVAAVYSGLSFGPFVGGLLTQNFGWRSIFLLNVALGILIIAVTIWKLRMEWVDAKGERFDINGSIVYGVSLSALMIGFSRLPGIVGMVSLIGGALGIAGFVVVESREKSPILDVSLFHKNKVFAYSNLAALINYSATAATAFLMSLYLQYIKGFSPGHAGLVLVSQPIVQAILSPVAGKISDRIEPQIVASVGMGATAIGLGALSFLDENTGLVFIISGLAFLGFGFALFSSPNTNAIMSSVERKLYGVASSTVATMRITGQMLSMGIATLVFALLIGTAQITPAYYPQFMQSVHFAFMIFAALCVIGVFASLSRGKIHEDKNNTPASGATGTGA